MRRIHRLHLPEPTQQAIDQKQTDADAKQVSGVLNVDAEWKASRQSQPIKNVLGVLQEMAGNRQRCMYCGDSHGNDIEHFWPKKQYPSRMFRWPNLLLCCTECGRFKGQKFPLGNGDPLLVDPTSEDPWQFLDFDPTTGNVVARFDLVANDWTAKGTKTVEVLHLDCREAFAAANQLTYRRVKALVEDTLQQQTIDAATLITKLRDADDHGLLGWCFSGTGQHIEPFARLRQTHPDVWQSCLQALA